VGTTKVAPKVSNSNAAVERRQVDQGVELRLANKGIDVKELRSVLIRVA